MTDNPRPSQEFEDDVPEENAEQRDEDQAQDVASDAYYRTNDGEDTERGGRDDPANLIPNDTPDLVERMNDMVASGHIDEDAFDGEPMHDDEESVLGETDSDVDEEDDLPDIVDTDPIDLDSLHDRAS